MDKGKNKVFKVVWEVHIERSYIESLMPPDGDERTVHDLVSIISIDRMKVGDTDLVYWMDEDHEEIHRLMGHHSMGVIAGETEPVEYDLSTSWDEEFMGNNGQDTDQKN